MVRLDRFLRLGLRRISVAPQSSGTVDRSFVPRTSDAEVTFYAERPECLATLPSAVLDPVHLLLHDKMNWDELAAGKGCPFDAPRFEPNEFWESVVQLSVSTLCLLWNQAYRGHCILIYDPKHVVRPDQLSAEEWAAYAHDLHSATKSLVEGGGIFLITENLETPPESPEEHVLVNRLPLVFDEIESLIQVLTADPVDRQRTGTEEPGCDE